MRSQRPACLSPCGTRAGREEGAPDKRVLLGTQSLRGEHRASLSPVVLTLMHSEIIWETFKPPDVWVPPPGILLFGEAQALGVLRSSHMILKCS